MKGKKESKSKEVPSETVEKESFQAITSRAELKSFISNVRDHLVDNSAPPLFGMTAFNYVLSLPELYDLMDSGAKETLQEIWVKLSQAGLQLKKPPILFGDGDTGAKAA